MSRLIDADKLCEDLLERWSIADTRKEELIRRVMADIVTPIIASQPTIEKEPKKGNWIVYKAPDKQHCGLVNCPFCGEDMIAEADEYNFCPNCGADMRGEQNG